MRVKYKNLGGDEVEAVATVTTEHPCSSYGVHVVVIDKEAVDAASWAVLGYEIIEASEEELELLAKMLRVPLASYFSALGKKGGSAKSEAKGAASKRNGRKGGRSKKTEKKGE